MPRDQSPSENTTNPYQSPNCDPSNQLQLTGKESYYAVVDGFAITSFVLGIVSLFVYAGGIVPGSLAIIFGHLSLRRIKKEPSKKRGKGLAFTGLILGYLMSAFTILFFYLILSNN